MIGCLELLGRSDVLFLLPNWKDSSGAKREYAYAKKHEMYIADNLEFLDLVDEVTLYGKKD
jgi:hypothetical protein